MNLSEHDVTKQILDKIRQSNPRYKPILNEEKNDVLKLTGEELKSEQKKFTENIGDSRVTFNVFNVYPYANNVVFGGEFDSGLQWQLSKEDGAYISINNTKLTDDLVQVIAKINAYYTNWANDWAKRLREEYVTN